MKTSDPKTNVQVVTDLMEFSKYGAMAQLFVIDALSKVAKKVALSPPEAFASMEGGFINPEVWKGVAREISEKLALHLGESSEQFLNTPDRVAKEYETYKGRLGLAGSTLEVEFNAPVGASKEEKDAAFVDALAQLADVDYVSVKQEFLAMQAEIESIEMSIAKGEETEQSDARLRELRERMEGSPWELDPDEGFREKSANSNRP